MQRRVVDHSKMGCHDLIVTMEDNVLSGGYGEHVTAFCEMNELKASVLSIAVPDEFVPHGSIAILREKLGMDPLSVAGRIINKLQEMADVR